jgi:hypothetical protein
LHWNEKSDPVSASKSKYRSCRGKIEPWRAMDAYSGGVDAHFVEEQDPNPYPSGKSHPDSHQNEKTDPGPDPHQGDP